MADQAGEQGAPAPETIQLKVKNAEGREVMFKLKMGTPLRKVSRLSTDCIICLSSDDYFGPAQTRSVCRRSEPMDYCVDYINA